MADEPKEHDEKPEAETDASASVEAKPEGEAPRAGAAKDDDAKDDDADDGDAAKDGDEADEVEDDEEVDAASPEAIAKRVAALGEEDEVEKIARAEEKKLAERRAKMRKGKGGKKGLEAAASKRLSKIGAKAVPKRTIATAVDADPLIEKTQQLTKWAKKNRRTVGIAAAAVVGIGLVLGGVTYFQHKHEADASVELAKAVADERGRIGDPDKVKDDDAPKDTTPMFKTADARRDSALAKYRDVEARFPNTGAAYLARLGEGSLLLDKHDFDGAIAAFNDAKSSPLAAADAEVRGRALEGLGFAYELKAQAGDADKWRDEASKAFRDLENTDVTGFKELGMYHQARVAEDKGDKAKAVELLKSVVERTTKPGESHPFPYLAQVSDDRLRALDPTALPPKASGMGGPGMGGPGGQMNDAQIKALIEQMKKRGGPPGGGPPGAPPGAPPK